MITELLPIHPGFRDVYLSKIEDGKKLLKECNITIISLVRSIDIPLNKNIPLVMNFFKTYVNNLNHIFYENDSIDDTKSILETYKKIYPGNIHIISKNFNREHFGSVKDQNRIKALAEYRNEAKEYAKTMDSNFIVVLDMDFDDINLDGLLNSFGWLATEQSVSAIAGNSFYLHSGLSKDDPKRYNIFNYDSWAFRHNWWTDLHVSPPAPSNTLDSMSWFGFWIPPTGAHPITVNSAFGGCGIYRKEIYFQGLYDHMDCEHVCFHYSLATNKDINFRLVLNPSQQMLFESIDV